MANQVLTNPLGAFGRSTGNEVNFQVVVPFEAVLGVAKNAAAAGAVVEVVVFGYAVCNIGSTSPALGNIVIIGASDGVAGVLAPAVAGTITGDNFGIFLGTEIGSTNTAAIWFSKF